MNFKKEIYLLFAKMSKAFGRLGIKRIPALLYLYRLIDKMFGVILIKCEGNRMYVNLQDKGLTTELLTKGTYGKCGTELIKNLIKPGMVVIDIGANIGYYTLIAARLVGKKGKVYAFEPEPNNYELLTKNIKINNYTNITPIRKGISNQHERVKLFLDKDDFGRHSLSKNNVGKENGSIEVETIILDDFVEKEIKNKVNFIKIDAQGAEGLILKGAERLLKNNDLKIFMEFDKIGIKNFGIDPLEVLYKLKDLGFGIKLVDYIDQRIREIEVKEIMEYSDKTTTDLLLEKQ